MATDPLLEFRARLNSIDERIVELLGARFGVCRDVAEYKRQRGIPMMQPARVAEVKARCAKLAESHGVNPDFAHRLYELIIDEACRLEDAIIDASVESGSAGS